MRRGCTLHEFESDTRGSVLLKGVTCCRDGIILSHASIRLASLYIMYVTRTDKLLTPNERQQFRDDGIVFPIRVLSAEQAQDYRRQCDLLEAQLGGRPRTVEVRQMHLHYPWAWQLATE